MVQALRISLRQGGLRQGGLRVAFVGRPSLDILFADNKSLVDAITGANLVDFTRASSGTYVDSDGLIKTAPVNLFTYSEQFDQWIVASNSVISPDAVVAPDGTNTADGLYFAATGATNVSQSVILTQGQQYTFSVYAKAVTPGSNNKFKPYINSLTPKSPPIDFESTSEWQRFSFTFTHTNSTGSNPVFILNQGDTYITNVYFWGAQLEEGTTATNYIPTTSTISGTPRFDHDPATGESLGLLIEEARTNLVRDSVGGWVFDSPGMSGPTSVDGPGGANTALQYLSTGGTNIVSKIQFKTASADNATQYTATVYVKGVNYNHVTFGFGGNGFPLNSRKSFYLDTLTTSSWPSGSTAELSIEDAGNGWRRLRVTTVATTSATSITAHLDLGGRDAEDHTSDQGFQLYGLQIEAGTFPTSYIPTSGSTVTRAADIAEITGTNFSSWYNQSEGTVFVKVLDAAYGQSDSYEISDGSVNNKRNIRIDANASKIKRTIVGAGSTSQQESGTNYTGYPVSFKAAATDNFKFFVDGVSGSTSGNLNALPTNMTQLVIGFRGSQSSNYLNGHISRLAYFPTRLPDATLQNITT